MKFYWFKFLCWLDERVIRHRSYRFCQYASMGLDDACEHLWLYKGVNEETNSTVWDCPRCEATEYRA